MRQRIGELAGTAAIALFVIAACTGGGGSPSPVAGGTQVGVTLQEWAVVPAAANAPAGQVTFNVTNSGPADPHEFVIIKTDLGALDLPTDDRGVVLEDGSGMEVIDEIEDIEVGQSGDLTVPLTAGAYLLICNIYDEDEAEAHYAMGMVTPFTVNP